MKQHLFLAGKIVLSIAIIVYLFSRIPLADIFDSLFAARFPWVAVGLLLSPMIFAFGAAQMRILLQKQRIFLSFWEIFQVNTISSFYSLFLPGSISGGAIRWYKFSQPSGRRSEAFAAIVFSRMYDMIILLLLGTVFWFFDPLGFRNRLLGLFLLAMLAGFSLFFSLFFQPKIFKTLLRWLELIPIMPQTLTEKMHKVLDSASLFHEFSLATHLRIFGLLLLRSLLGVLIYYLFSRSLGLGLSLVNVAWIRTIVMILTMVPISFSGLGVREGGLLVMLQPYGVSPPEAVALAFLLLGREIFNGVIGGIMEGRQHFRTQLPAEL